MPSPRILIGRPFLDFPSVPVPSSSDGSVEENHAHAEAWIAAFRAFKENKSFERMVAPIEPVAREYLRKAGLPFDPGMEYVFEEHKGPGSKWIGTLEFLMRDCFGEDSAEFCAANLLRLIRQIRLLLAQQGPAESVLILTRQLMVTLEYAKNTRLFTTGGRPPDMEEEAFRQDYWGAYQRLLDQARRDGNRLPHKQEVADEMLIHRRTLTRNLARYNMPWPPLLPR